MAASTAPSLALVLGQFPTGSLHVFQEAPAVNLHHAVLANSVAVGPCPVALVPLEPVNGPALPEFDLKNVFEQPWNVSGFVRREARRGKQMFGCETNRDVVGARVRRRQISCDGRWG